MAIFVGLMVFGVLYLASTLVSCSLFLYYFVLGRKYSLATDLSRGSAILAIIASLAGASIVFQAFLMSWLRSMGLYRQCEISALIHVIWTSLFFTSISLRSFHLLALKRLNESKFEYHQAYQNTKALPLTRSWYWLAWKKLFHGLGNDFGKDRTRVVQLHQIYNIWACRVNYVLYSVVFTIILALLTSILILVEQSFDPDANSALCQNQWLFPYIPLYAVAIFHYLFVFPTLLYGLRRTRDGYGIQWAMYILILQGFVAVPLYVVLRLVNSHIRPFNILPLIMFVMIHIVTIIRPSIELLQSRKTLDQLEYTVRDLSRALSDKKLRSKLQQEAVDGFAAETLLFWDAYYDFMRQVHLLILENLEMEATTDTIAKSVSPNELLIQELNKDVSCSFTEYLLKRGTEKGAALQPTVSADAGSNSESSDMMLVSPSRIIRVNDFEMMFSIGVVMRLPQELVDLALNLNDQFLRKDAEFELNLPESIMRGVESEMQIIRKYASLSSEISGSYIFFSTEQGKRKKVATSEDSVQVFRLAAFERAKGAVLDIIFSNIFPKLLHQMRDKSGSRTGDQVSSNTSDF